MSCSNSEMAFFPANFMLQAASHEEDDHRQHHQHPPPSSFTQILPSCTPQDYHGMVSFLGKRSVSFSGVEVSAEEVPNTAGEDELSDDGSQAGEKKRRLNMEQVKTLEKNFELGNKLEPERKMQLARALGLQPRQIAIWFQNRRARWKTKQLEKDYDLLKRQFEAVKADNEALQAQNQKLQAEIQALKSREPAESINLNKETEGSSSNRSENSSDFKLDISTRTPPAMDSPPPLAPPPPPPPPHPVTSHQLFPASSSLRSANGGPAGGGLAHHLLNSSSSSSRPDLMVKEEAFTNMFCGIDDQSGFWPWLEQQHFN